MTILFVSAASIMLKAFLLPLAAHLRNLGWIVCAAASGASRCPECVRGFDSSFDISWNRNPLGPSTLFRSARQIRELVRRRQFDLVHVHTPVAAFVTRWALRKSRSTGRPKIIYTAHGFHFHRGGSFLRNRVFLAMARSRCDRRVAPADKLAGRESEIFTTRDRKLEAARRQRQTKRQAARATPGESGMRPRKKGVSAFWGCPKPPRQLSGDPYLRASSCLKKLGLGGVNLRAVSCLNLNWRSPFHAELGHRDLSLSCAPFSDSARIV